MNRDNLVVAIHNIEKTGERVKSIDMAEGFYQTLKQESSFPELFQKKDTIYEIPYTVSKRIHNHYYDLYNNESRLLNNGNELSNYGKVTYINTMR